MNSVEQRGPASDAQTHRAPSCLIVLAHPRLDRSLINSTLAAEASSRRDVHVADLYDRYPDYQIDVAREQSMLLAHDVIGLQFPMFWYSMPALLKEWFDLVWLHGFAYGGGAPKLAGKTLFCAVTTGGDADSYHPVGRNAYPVEDFLRPVERTAALCGMHWARPHILHDAPRLRGDRLSVAAKGYGPYIAARLEERGVA